MSVARSGAPVSADVYWFIIDETRSFMLLRPLWFIWLVLLLLRAGLLFKWAACLLELLASVLWASFFLLFFNFHLDKASLAPSEQLR